MALYFQLLKAFQLTICFVFVIFVSVCTLYFEKIALYYYLEALILQESFFTIAIPHAFKGLEVSYTYYHAQRHSQLGTESVFISTNLATHPTTKTSRKELELNSLQKQILLHEINKPQNISNLTLIVIWSVQPNLTLFSTYNPQTCDKMIRFNLRPTKKSYNLLVSQK